MKTRHEARHDGSPNGGRKPRPTIAMFINWLTGMHQQQWLGVVDSARAHGVNLLSFSGKELEHPDHFYSHASVVFDLVSPQYIDGLIVWTTTLQHFVGREKMEVFCQRFHPLPMVSVEQRMPGMNCLLVDEQRGTYELISHLIEVHGHERIAFVRGPEYHPGAELRYLGYVQALTEHGLAVDPALVTPPPRYWMPEYAAAATNELLDRHGLRIDAIAAANDDLALGVVWALQRRGLRIPADMAVVGFDDAINIQHPDLGIDSLRDEAASVTPRIYSSATATMPLTTVRSPTYQLGWRALEVMLAVLRGEPVAQETTIPAPLVLRRSCGCLPGGAPKSDESADAVAHVAAPISLLPADVPANASLGASLAELLGCPASPAVEERAASLLGRFVQSAQGGAPGDFLYVLDDIVRSSVSTQAALTRWWPWLFNLRKQAQARCVADPADTATLAGLQELWQRTQALMWEWTGRLHEYEIALASKREQIVRQVGQKLITTLDLGQMVRVMVDELPTVGLSSCYLALYEPEPAATARPESYPTPLSRAILVYDHGRRIELPAGGEVFESHQLVPGGVGRNGEPRSMVVMPLYFQDRQLGFVALEGALREGWVYEALRAQLSSAVQGALMVERERRALAEAEQARERAEVASQARSTFLSTMSHELRTPLNAILGYAQILQLGRGLTPQQAKGIQTIRSSGEHLLTLINDILDLAKIDASRFELDPNVVQMRTFIRVVGDIIRVKCEEKGLHFECETADMPDAVRIDEKRLRQVLLNLLANAVKFTDRGVVSLCVRGFAEAGGSALLRFEVADSGVGIAAQDQQAIFEAFEQVGESRRRSTGTGLGLAISRRLVRLMGGDIHVESEVGKGSLFWFELSVPAASPYAPHAHPADGGRIAGYGGCRKTLLIVDDIGANRALLADHLSPLGFVIEQASSGEEAIESVRCVAPDLVLMDIVMPGMDGVEATRRIRAMPGLQKLPVVAVSANASPENLERCMAAGASGFMSKPLDRDLLLQELRKHLGLEWTMEAAGGQAAQTP